MRSGRLSEKRIDESVRRILQAKARLGLDKNRFADIEHLDQRFGRPEFEIAGAEHCRSRRHAAARHSAACCRSMRQSRCASCWFRFPPMRTLIPGETIEPEIRWRVDSLKSPARGYTVREREHAESCRRLILMTSLSSRSLCVSPTAKEMWDFRTTSAHSWIRCWPQANPPW